MIDAFRNPKFLGMNYRNMQIISKYNATESIKLVNDKIKFKKLLEINSVPTPKSLTEINLQSEIVKKVSPLHPPFVIKPNKGFAGGGILIITKKEADNFRGNSDKVFTLHDIKRHIQFILNGYFSLGSESDSALVEEMLVSPEFITKLSPLGLPDIRIIYYMRNPICTMMRLPTKKSEGKANLSLGALGLHLDLETGKILALYDKKTKKRTSNLPKNYRRRLPDWNKVLQTGKKAVSLSNLGFAGVDIVYGKKGPMIMELNAKPGLEIQNVTSTNMLEKIFEDREYHEL